MRKESLGTRLVALLIATWRMVFVWRVLSEEGIHIVHFGGCDPGGLLWRGGKVGPTQGAARTPAVGCALLLLRGKTENCQVIIIHNSGLIPRLLFTRKQSGNETTNYWGGGAHLMVHDLRKWNQLLAELAWNLLFI